MMRWLIVSIAAAIMEASEDHIRAVYEYGPESPVRNQDIAMRGDGDIHGLAHCLPGSSRPQIKTALERTVRAGDKHPAANIVQTVDVPLGADCKGIRTALRRAYGNGPGALRKPDYPCRLEIQRMEPPLRILDELARNNTRCGRLADKTGIGSRHTSAILWSYACYGGIEKLYLIALKIAGKVPVADTRDIVQSHKWRGG